jgi:hypothetical protein
MPYTEDGSSDLEGGDLELGAVLGVAVHSPVRCSVSPHSTPGSGPTMVTRRSGRALAAGLGGPEGVGAEFRDGVVVLLVEKDDALEDAGEGAGSGRRPRSGGSSPAAGTRRP